MEVIFGMRKIIGNNLRVCRQKQKLSQHDLAEKCLLAQKDISNIENYRWNFGIDKIKKLSRGLAIRPYELMINAGEITAKSLLEKYVFEKGVVHMLYEYYLLLSQNSNEDFFEHPIETYGIGLKDHAIPCVKDVSPDKEFVESLVALCNLQQVDPVHLLNVVEDAIFEREQ